MEYINREIELVFDSGHKVKIIEDGDSVKIDIDKNSKLTYLDIKDLAKTLLKINKEWLEDYWFSDTKEEK